MLGLDEDVHFIRTRGYSVWEATVSGGDPGTFILNRLPASPEDVRAFANRLRKRLQILRLPSHHIPMADNNPKDQQMSNKYRGLSENDIRDDMRKLVKEHGSHPAAAAACGIAKSTRGNSLRGIANIGDKVMDGLYGPSGTDLRPEVRAKPKKSHEVAEAKTVPPPAKPPESAIADQPADDSAVAPKPEQQLVVATLLTLAHSERDRMMADIEKLDAQINCLKTLTQRFDPAGPAKKCSAR